MIEILRARRSIRKFERRPIEADKVALLEEALLLSPSSRGLRPWRFVFVDRTELLERLARSRPHGSSFVAGAALAIVVCGDEGVSDIWVEDCSIAAIMAQLAACSLGLGSCWVQIRGRPCSEDKTAEEHVRETLGLPDDLRVEAVVALGYAAEAKTPHPRESLPFDRIWRNGPPR